jgi:hypothetical protein
MQNLLMQFKSLPEDQKLAFMKKEMVDMAEIFRNDPHKMMAEMMPACMNAMQPKGMDMEKMRSMMKNIMG